MLGQIRIEFIFGLMLFILLIVFIVAQTNVLFTSLITDSKSDRLKAKAINSIKILVEDKGDPENWWNAPDANVKRVGLAEQPYNLSINKINRLASPNNCTLLDNFDLGAYRLKISNSTQQLLMCGPNSLEPATVTEVKKSLY